MNTNSLENEKLEIQKEIFMKSKEENKKNNPSSNDDEQIETWFLK